MKNTRLSVLFTLMLLSLAIRAHGEGDVNVETIRVPNGGSYPQALTDRAGRIHLIYVNGDPMRADVYYVRSDDSGKSFSRPIVVNSHPQSAVITGTVRGPHLALGRDDRVHVAWMGSDKAQPRVNGKAAPMLYTRMNDAGNGFEPQRNVIQAHPGLDGGGSIAADVEGNVCVAWHAPDGGEGEENRNVWIVRSEDEGRTFGQEMAVLPKKVGVCGCCGMRIAATEKGKVYIVVRSANESVNRDIYLLASDDYGKTFKVAVVDPWKVGTCVMSTASFSATAQRTVVAWETQEQVRLAAMDSKSTVLGVPIPVAAKNKVQKHPAVATNGRGQSIVAWAVGTGWNKGGSVAWQAFDADGQPIVKQSGERGGLPVWGVPAVVGLPDGSFRIIY